MKILLILFTCFLSFIKTPNKTYQAEKIFKTSFGDIITLESLSPISYRLNYNSSLAIDIEITSLYSNPILFMEFYEGDDNYIFYGYVGDKQNEKDTIGYVYIIEKDFSSYELYSHSEVGLSSSIDYILSYPYGYISIFEKERIDEYEYTKVLIVDYDFNIINEKELDVLLTTKPSILYNYLVCETPDIIYLDEELNIYNDYKCEISKTGDFTLFSDTYVNGLLYKRGSHFSTPGIYTLSSLSSDSIILTIDPLIEGIEEKGSYDKYVEFKVSGGEVYLDNKKTYLNGIVMSEGWHTLKVLGVGGYTKEISFLIKPRIITDISSSLKDGDIISFSGYIKVDDSDFIEEEFECKEGSHKIELYADKETEPVDTYYIDVGPKLSKKKLTLIYCIEGVLLGSIVLILVITIRSDIKKRRRKTEI